MKAHVGIPVAILYPDDEVANDGHAGAVAGELLVGHLGIVLLRLYELVVEVQVVRLSGHELPCIQEHIHQQAVQSRGCIEVIALTCLRSIGRVGAAQLGDSPENGVGAASAESGVKREMGHQVARHILHAAASAEVDA